MVRFFCRACRPDTVFYSNIGFGAKIDTILGEAGLARWKDSCKLVSLAHGRGSDELTWRAEKKFGSEKLPLEKLFPQRCLLLYDDHRPECL